MHLFEEVSDEQLRKLLKEKKIDEFADEISQIYVNKAQQEREESGQSEPSNLPEENSGTESGKSDLLEVDKSGEFHFEESETDEQSPSDQNGKKNYDCMNRNHIITFRVNDEELAAIEERFRQSEIFRSRGDYCRHSAVTAFVFAEDKERMESIAKSAARIAYSFNQIAYRVNRSDNIYEQDIEEMKKGIEEIWQLLTFMQSKRESVHQFNTSLTQLKPETAGWLLALYVYHLHREQANSSGKSVRESEEEKPQSTHST